MQHRGTTCPAAAGKRLLLTIGWLLGRAFCFCASFMRQVFPLARLADAALPALGADFL